MEDTDLRFEKIKAGIFRCPNCGGTVTEPPEEPPVKTKQANLKRYRAAVLQAAC